MNGWVFVGEWVVEGVDGWVGMGCVGVYTVVGL